MGVWECGGVGVWDTRRFGSQSTASQFTRSQSTRSQCPQTDPYPVDEQRLRMPGQDLQRQDHGQRASPADAGSPGGGARGLVQQPQGGRQPGQGVELVDVFDAGEGESAEREEGAGQPRGRPAEAQRAPAEGVGEPRGKPDVQQRGPDERLGRLEPVQRPMERVEHRGLRVRQERRAQEEVRIPEWNVSRGQLRYSVGPVGGEVGERIHPGQHAVCQPEGPEHDERHQRQACPRQQVCAENDCPLWRRGFSRLLAFAYETA